MTNLTNALNLLNNYIDPEGTPLDGALHLLETTPDPEMEMEINPYLVEDAPLPPSPSTQPEPTNVFYRSWSGTEYPTLESIPWQSRGSAVAVLAE